MSIFVPLGLAIDLSHSCDRTALDTCAASSEPVFITHAARAGCDTARMKPDPVLKAVVSVLAAIAVSGPP